MNLGEEIIKENWRQPGPVESRDWGVQRELILSPGQKNCGVLVSGT